MIIKRFIQEIDSNGDIAELIDLDSIPAEDGSKLLERACIQAMERIGYKLELTSND